MNAELLTTRVEQLAGRFGFTLAGRDHWLREDVSLVEWIAALYDPASDAVCPALLADPHRSELYEHLFDDYHPFDGDLCRRIGLQLVEDVGGRPWWEVLRLVSIAVDAWPQFDAWCAHEASGLDPRALSLSRFVNLVHRYVLLCCENDEDRDAFLAGLAAPPANAAAELEDRAEWADDSTAADFDQAFAQFGALGGASTG